MNAEKSATSQSVIAGVAKQSPARIWLSLLLAIIFLAFALRMVRIADLRMWGDEGFSVFSANRDLLTITLDTTTIDPHPPLYYYLLHFYFLIAGRSELAIRFFSVFFGTATVALTWLVGKRMFSKWIGMFAAFFTAIAPFAVHYSQEVRMYALAMFLATLGLYFFVRVWRLDALRPSAFPSATDPADEGRLYAFVGANSFAWYWIGYASAMLLALYTLYHTALVFLAQGLLLLPLFRTRRVFVLRWFAISLGIVATFLPWLVFRYVSAFTGIKDVAGDTVPMDLATFVVRGLAAISVGTTIPLSQAVQLAGLYALLIAIALIIARVTRIARIHDALLLLLVIVPIGAYYPLYLALPLYRGRLFALACIPLMLLFARSTIILAQRARLALIPMVLLVVGTSAYSLNDYYFRYDRYSAAVEDYLPLIHSVEQRAQPGDVVLFHAYWQEGYFLSHYHGAPLQYRFLDQQSDLDAAVAQSRNVWAVVQGVAEHGGAVWLAQNAFLVSEQKFGQIRLLSYRAGTPARGETFATPVVFSNGITLLGYHTNDAALESGRGIVTLQLDWQAAQKIADDYVVSIRVTNLRGDVVWSQGDDQPASGTLPTSAWQPGQVIVDHHALIVPAAMPPGEYAIRVVIYESKSSRAANIVAPDNLRGQTLALGNISIVKPGGRSVPAIPNSFGAQWGEIALVGFASVADEITAGDALPLTLYWRAQQKPTRDYLALIQVIDSSGAVRALARYRPANETFPTRAWDAGETWLDKIVLNISADAAPGDTTVLVSLWDEQSGNAIALNTLAPVHDNQVPLARLQINAREHRFTAPPIKFALPATLGDKTKLLGYDLDAEAVKPGTSLPLTLYWQALDKVGERYTVFVHLLDAAGNIVAQRDGEPGGGNAPTTSWLRGEYIVDAYDIALPQNLAVGEYSLVVGMYQATSGKRLTVSETNSDRVLLTRIAIVR